MTLSALKSLWVLLFLLVCQSVPAQETSGNQESSGTAVISGDFFDSFQLIGDASEAELERVAVQGQSFTEAWRITGKTQPANPWDVQLGSSNSLSLNQGDTLVLRFWARALSPQARTEFVFEQDGPPWEKSLTAGIILDQTWREVQIPFQTLRAFAPGQASALFRLGYGEQSFELANFSLESFANTRAVTDFPTLGFSYHGREADAPWRQEAEKRIDEIRKADLEIRVVDSQGNPVEGVRLELDQSRHDFAFGSAVDAERLFSQDADGERYRQTIDELFNWVVLENDLKWPVWECCRRELALKALDYFAERGVKVRGHNLLWPCYEDYCLPQDAANLLNQPEALQARISEHFSDILSATQGKLVHWDVINEPSANKRLADVYGEDQMAEWFKQVKGLEPHTQLYLNDYGNLGEGTLDVEFKRIISRMQELGAPLEGIGLQGHFGWQLTPPEELYERLDSFAQFGLPLMITEFDVTITDEQLQADYLRDFFTIAFSHPAVDGILMWGFWEGQHWMPEAALYRSDWSAKANAHAYQDLVFNTWRTKEAALTDSTGGYKTRAFLGDYYLRISHNDVLLEQTIHLDKAGQSVIIVVAN
ncbi:MAG: endo-1,4-beta-xylanase [Trueperaceae bacterium]|nr:endo-1,4-beta-xylanase [Trueperaceae bacterium]